MKLKGFRQTKQGRYLSSYELAYENKEGKEKIYEMVSREKNLSADSIGEKTAGIAIAGFKGDEVLLIKEFRMGVNTYVWAFPAGLIEDGESPEDAARRELKEETGMEIIKIKDMLNPSFSCSGVTDETSMIVFCEVDGEIENSKFADEEIEAKLLTKYEVRKLMDEEMFAARTQSICYLWAKE